MLMADSQRPREPDKRERIAEAEARRKRIAKKAKPAERLRKAEITLEQYEGTYEVPRFEYNEP